MEADEVRAEFQHVGRVWFRGKLNSHELSVLDGTANLDQKAGERIAPRSEIMDVLSRDSGLARIMSLFGRSLVPVRIVGFNKTQQNNWGVPWHQDRIISVAERHDLPGFGNWSSKSGIWHCEPPEAILDQMFFVRVHLDDTSSADGAMRIAVGSHKEGVIPADGARSVAETYPTEECRARRGDVLVLKMLTLHASHPSKSENTRRVFRVDYAPADLLPVPLAWHGLCSDSD